MKSDIVYSDDTLFVYLEGSMNKKSINNLKRKIYTIIDEYQINDVVFDMEKVISFDPSLELLLKDYNNIYNSDIKLIK